jgi:hypothetical protein
MRKIAKVVKTFEESDRADGDYYQSVTPHQRLEILWEMNSRWQGRSGDETSDGIERVCRIVRFSRGATGTFIVF